MVGHPHQAAAMCERTPTSFPACARPQTALWDKFQTAAQSFEGDFELCTQVIDGERGTQR